MKNILFTFQNENDTVFIGSGEETKRAVLDHLTILGERNSSSQSYLKIIRESYNQISHSNCKFFKFRIDNAGMMWLEAYKTITPVLEYIQLQVN